MLDVSVVADFTQQARHLSLCLSGFAISRSLLVMEKRRGR